MSKVSFHKVWIRFCVSGLIAAGFCSLSGCAQKRQDFAAFPRDAVEVLERAIVIPPGSYEIGSEEPGCFTNSMFTTDGYLLWPVEVPRSWWEKFRPSQQHSTDQQAAPVTTISHDDAVAFCAWFSKKLKIKARLPTREEWEIAARAGTPGVMYPWGWGAPRGRSVYDAEGVSPVASLEANPWGFFDMAGNVAEWTASAGESNEVAVMGGSWAERDPRYLRISHALWLRKDYQNADVGFRILIEPDYVAR